MSQSGLADIALFPLQTVLFPGGLLPLRLFEQRYLEMAKGCLREDRPFGVCRIREGQEVGDPATPETVGCLARIAHWDMAQLGVLNIVARGEGRFRILERHVERDGLVRGGHWASALHDPSLLASDVMGGPLPAADPARYTFSTQHGHSLALFGQPAPGQRVVVRGDPREGGEWGALYVEERDGLRPGEAVLTAGLAVDAPRAPVVVAVPRQQRHPQRRRHGANQREQIAVPVLVDVDGHGFDERVSRVEAGDGHPVGRRQRR